MTHKSKTSHLYDILNKRYGYDHKSYSPNLVNGILSGMYEFASEIPHIHQLFLDKKLHYNFLFLLVEKRYRKMPPYVNEFKDKDEELALIIANDNEISLSEAKKVLKFLSDKQKENIKMNNHN